LQSPSPNDRRSSGQRLASRSTPQFPPILLDSGNLQADGSKKSPSPQPGDKRPFAPANSDVDSAQDEPISPRVLKLHRELLSKSLDELK